MTLSEKMKRWEAVMLLTKSDDFQVRDDAVFLVASSAPHMLTAIQDLISLAKEMREALDVALNSKDPDYAIIDELIDRADALLGE
jgi:hypothetical protein